MSKIYDCFLFFNEIELLELRLELLYPHVDYFVISECDSTFSGLEKEFYFENNIHKFEKYMDKIIHLKHYNTEDTYQFVNNHEGHKKDIFDDIVNKFKQSKGEWKSYDHWRREVFHRELVKLGMDNCVENDIIIFSDLDEIPNPDIFEKLQTSFDLEQKYVLIGDTFNYYINVKQHTNWYGGFVCTYKKIQKESIKFIREDRKNFVKIDGGGWHFSFIGGAERIRTKIKSWGHQEFNYDYILENVENKINSLSDLFNRTNDSYKNNETKFYFDKMLIVDLDETFPKKLCDFVRKKFPHFIKN